MHCYCPSVYEIVPIGSSSVVPCFRNENGEIKNTLHSYFINSVINSVLHFISKREYIELSDQQFFTAQKMKFSIKDFLVNVNKFTVFLRTCLHLPKKSSKEALFFVQCLRRWKDFKNLRNHCDNDQKPPGRW